ncbi:MAG: hypothetical protein WA941_20300 [Nitrososphaeraceae archaeon]
MTLRRNPRAGIKRNKYKALVMDHRIDRVKELLIKGYSQEQISKTLRISQPTVSRDLEYIHDGLRKRIDVKTIEDIISHYYMAFLELDQLTKYLWRIVINTKTKDYDKLRALKQLEECSSQRLMLIDRAVNDAVLPYISKQLEYLNKKDLALKSRVKDLEDRANR